MKNYYGGMHSVKVMFADEKYNYVTSISPQSTEESAKKYFVGKFFDMGCFPVEDLQKCTGIEFSFNKMESAISEELVKAGFKFAKQRNTLDFSYVKSVCKAIETIREQGQVYFENNTCLGKVLKEIVYKNLAV